MLRRSLLSLALVLAATPAFAHLDPGEHGSFAAGFSHPLLGLDHILAMAAVGLWAWQNGRAATWAVPASFVAAMLIGFGLAMLGAPLPFVEPAILASVVALGLLVALAVRLPLAPGAALVGLFALFHGHAHGGEIGAAGVGGYALGFALATILLHAAGIALGLAIGRLLGEHSRAGALLPRALGGLTAVAGLGLIVG